MNKELNPKVAAVIIVVVVLIAAFFLWRTFTKVGP